VKVGDRQKYIKRSTAAQWGVQKAPTGVHQRPVGVQMYSCLAVWGVQEYVAEACRRTDVQLFSSTESPGLCCCRGWWQLVFSKKGPRHGILRIV
jgi:hypothetical protein